MLRGWGCGGGIAGCCGIWSTWWTSGACTCEIFPHVELTLGRDTVRNLCRCSRIGCCELKRERGGRKERLENLRLLMRLHK